MVKKKQYLITFIIAGGLGWMLNTDVEHERTFAFTLIYSVPLKSSIEPVAVLAKHERIEISSMYVWRKAAPGATKVIESPFGRFTSEEVGEFETGKVGKSFTGRIELWIQRNYFMKPVVVWFDFVNGTLWRRDWGYGPG